MFRVLLVFVCREGLEKLKGELRDSIMKGIAFVNK